MATDPKKPAPLRFGEPEKSNWKKITLMGTLIVLAVLGIVWMAKQSTRMPSLSCSAPSGNGSWSSFGRCHED